MHGLKLVPAVIVTAAVALAGCGDAEPAAKPTPTPTPAATPDPEIYDQFYALESLVCLLAHVEKRYEDDLWKMYRKRQLDPRSYRADYPECP